MQLFTALLCVLEHMSVFNLWGNFSGLNVGKNYPMEFSEVNCLLHGDAYSSSMELIRRCNLARSEL